MTSALDLRKDAIVRLVEIAADYRSPRASGGWEGDWSRIDIAVIRARKETRALLGRHALAAATDDLTRSEVLALLKIADGDATTLIDTIPGGLPEAAQAMDLDEFCNAIQEALA